MKLLTRRGQSTGEYAILFAIVLGAVFAVQNFVRHNIAGNLKQQADDYMIIGATAESISTVADTAQRSHMKMETSSDGVVDSASNTLSTSTAL